MNRQIFFLLFFVALFSLKCSDDNLYIDKPIGVRVLIDTESKFEAEYITDSNTLNFEAAIFEGVITSYFRVHKNGGDKIIIKNVVDVNTPAFKFLVHREVLNEALLLLDYISSENDIAVLRLQFEYFAKVLLFNESLLKHPLDLKQNLFIHNAVLSTTSRSIQTESIAECTPHPGYFVGKTSFWCQEDYIIDTGKFVNAITQSGYQLNDDEKKLFDFLVLVKENERFVTLDKLLAVVESKEEYMGRVELETMKLKGQANDLIAECTKGSALGCCGNYSGCCWYWSLFCLWHDIECLQCDIWHCGPACVPETT